MSALSKSQPLFTSFLCKFLNRNSYYLGERPNGYISFSYDITQQFRFDAENIITVYVDRREIAHSRWFTGSKSLWYTLPPFVKKTVPILLWDRIILLALECEFAPFSERWDYIQGELIVVKCYTNLEEAEFFLNKTSLGVYHDSTMLKCVSRTAVNLRCT